MSSFEANAHKIIDWAAKISTTNIRIFVTLGIIVYTAITYMNSATWVPSNSWLTFLFALCGADVTQYGIKRLTFKGNGNGASDDNGGSTASTDVQEISQTVTKG